MITDAILRNYVDQVFMTYDRDRSGSLEPNQLANFFNDIFEKMHNPSRYTIEQASRALRQIDSNFDGRATKPELFAALKKLMGQSGLSNDDYKGSNSRMQHFSSYASSSNGATYNPSNSGYTQNFSSGGSNMNGFNPNSPRFNSANNQGLSSTNTQNYSSSYSSSASQGYNQGMSQNAYMQPGNQNFVGGNYNQSSTQNYNQGFSGSNVSGGQYSVIDGMKSNGNSMLSTNYNQSRTVYAEPQVSYAQTSRVLQPNTLIGNITEPTTTIVTSTVSEPGVTKITTTSAPGYTKVTTETYSTTTTYQY